MEYKFVALEGIERGNRFYSTFTKEEDPTLSAKGEVWYRVLGYGNTAEEMQKILYPNPGDEARAMVKHLLGFGDRL